MYLIQTCTIIIAILTGFTIVLIHMVSKRIDKLIDIIKIDLKNRKSMDEEDDNPSSRKEWRH